MVLTTDRHHDPTPPTQDLIPEVRERTRRRRLRTGLRVLVTGALLLALAAAGWVIVRGPASVVTSSSPPGGGTVTLSSLGPHTTIGDVQMLSTQRGFAVAYSFVDQPRPMFYLVATSNGARAWHVVAPLGHDGRIYWAPTVDFVTARVGYVTFYSTPRIAVTTDGGHSWRTLATRAPGLVTSPMSLAVSGPTATVVWTACVQSPVQHCHSYLTTYRLGTTTALTRHAIPDFNEPYSSEQLLDVTASHDAFIVSSGGGQMHESPNAGVTWRSITTPCTWTSGSQIFTMAPTQFTTFSNGTWLLGCARAVGMMHENTGLWSSSTQGATWHQVAYTGIGHRDQGNLMGAALTFVWSNDHRVLYALWQSALAGVGWTTDGTRWHWTLNDSPNASYPAFLTPWGPRGVIYSSPVDILAGTSDGSTWLTLRGESGAPTTITSGRVVVSSTTTTTSSS